MKENTILQIDVEALFKKKNKKVASLIPGFVFGWIKKLIHQNEINRALRSTSHLQGAEFARFIVEKEIAASIQSNGLEKIPHSGGAIIVSNHPLGGLDGMVLMAETSKVRSDVKVIVNDLLTEIPNFGDIFIPVNKLGRNARTTLQRVEEAYSGGHLVLVFPAGLCSRKTKGLIRDMPWQKSFISRAQRYRLPVIPVHFSGQNSNRFYNLANWRKKLGIKTNIEMFLLVDELFRQKGKKFTITIGKPVSPDYFDRKHAPERWAQLLRDFVYILQENPDMKFEDFADQA